MSSIFTWIQQLVRELRRRRVIRVAMVYAGSAFVVLQLGEILVEPFGLPGWTMRMVTFLLVLGFLPAVALAWVYNITEEGLIRIDEGSGGESVDASHQGKPFTSNAVIIGLLVLIAGLLIYPRVTGPSQPNSSEHIRRGRASSADTTTATDSTLANVDPASVAVLPFTYLAAEDSADYLSIGMTDEILTRLSQIDELSVRGRTSVMQYQGTDKTIPEIGRELEVAHVVEGSIEMIGDQLQITVQLVDAREAEHRWSRSFQGRFENVIDLQNQVARAVAEQLPASIGIEEKRQLTGAPEVAPEAYRLYLQARRLRFNETADDLTEAVQLLERSLAVDTTFAPAWALLSFCSMFVPIRGGALPDKVRGIDSDSLPRVAARRALTLDSTSAEAHVAMGVVREVMDQNYTRAGPHFQRAVELNPGLVNGHREYGIYLMRLGRFEMADRYLHHAVHLDPASVIALRTLARNKLYRGRYQQAKQFLDRSRTLDERAVFVTRFLWRAYVAQDSAEYARQKFSDQIAATRELWMWQKLWAYGQTGARDSARRVAHRIRQTAADLSAREEMILRAQLGQLEEALKVLPDTLGPYVKISPYYEPVRHKPRFQQRLKEMGLDEKSVQQTIERLDPDPPPLPSEEQQGGRAIEAPRNLRPSRWWREQTSGPLGTR